MVPPMLEPEIRSSDRVPRFSRFVSAENVPFVRFNIGRPSHPPLGAGSLRQAAPAESADAGRTRMSSKSVQSRGEADPAPVPRDRSPCGPGATPGDACLDILTTEDVRAIPENLSNSPGPAQATEAAAREISLARPNSSAISS